MTAPDPDTELTLTREDFERAYAFVSPYVHKTPMLTSRMLNEATGYDVHVKAELFQRGGAYKIRGPLNKIANLSEADRARGIICSSAGNHSQGIALAARQYGIPAVVVMAQNATPTKIAATKSYGAEVVLHGSIWDEANEKALELAHERNLTYIHPFDDPQLIAGQGTVGLEIFQDVPDVDVVVVPIGGGGLISGVSMAMKSLNPSVRIVGVESAGAPAMKKSVEAGKRITLDVVDTIVDGLRVKRVGALNLSVVSRFVDEIVTLPDEDIFDAVLWIMAHMKVVPEGAAAATVGALLGGLIKAAPGAKVVCVLSGGNLDVEKLRGTPWN
jgi:threonine dehydratase